MKHLPAFLIHQHRETLSSYHSSLFQPFQVSYPWEGTSRKPDGQLEALWVHFSGSCLQFRNMTPILASGKGVTFSAVKTQKHGFPRNSTVPLGHSTAHLHHSCQLLPLLLPGIHPGGVVSTSVQDDDALLWNFLRKMLQSMNY